MKTSKVDISTPRMVSLEEVAILWETTVVGIRERIRRGTFPVKPKEKRPLRWSSTELVAYFANEKRRA